MSLIVWSPILHVGIQIIDEQHKKLIDIINRLNEAMSQGKGKAVMGRILDELIEYTKTHFSMEERLMREHTYSHSPSHQSEHKKFIKSIGDFKTKYESGDTTLSVSILTFLCDWLTHHIQESDKALGRELREKNVT
jgi:hemerythrin-like metal-binding protein